MALFTLNGCKVRESRLHENGYTTVMVKRGHEDFIVATWWPQLGETWMWGHYDLTYADAAKVYQEVSQRNDMRGAA